MTVVNQPAKSKVIVGLSGGVDSSVVAWWLQQRDYQVECVFMKNWEEDDADDYCASEADLQDAQIVCDQLQLPLRVVNFSTEYWEQVFSVALTEYQAGNTPNPDILCNKHIKFKLLLDYAKRLGAEYLATGHYARIQSANNSNYQLLKGLDNHKDQSYFLYTLTQQKLSNIMFPLGEYCKLKVRELAKQIGLANHQKKDSTGICFIGERKFSDFLERYIKVRPGNIETTDGEIIGQHKGISFYTLGQRKGLGIGGQAGKLAQPWRIVSKDVVHNVLIVAQDPQHDKLLANQLIAKNCCWISGEFPQQQLSCQAKIRYQQADQLCVVVPVDDGKLQVTFAKPQTAITPGQSIVFYQQDVCLGGGIIDGIISTNGNFGT